MYIFSFCFSTLTLGMLKKQYLAEAGCESLSSEAKKFMKQVVEEELLKMQVSETKGLSSLLSALSKLRLWVL